ncbi:NAD-glutamate dehydrogenase [bacterium]|nr:NAD-glutamate dehydrogenase [bacterium]
MDILTEASQYSGLSVSDLKKIIAMLVKRGNFSEDRIKQELYTFCVKIGMVDHYFKTTPLETIANHIESISAAEIMAINRGLKEMELDFMSEQENSAMYLLNDNHEKGNEIERRMDDSYGLYRMQSYRTAGIQLESHFRSYFIQKPIFPEPNPDPMETDIHKVASKQFLESTTPETIKRYQMVLKKSIAMAQPFIHVGDGIRDSEIRIMVSVPEWDAYRFTSGVSDIINYYGLVSKHKYIEPFSCKRRILSVYLDAESTRPYLDDMITDISLIAIHPENELSPLLRTNTLSVHEAFYAIGACNFTHQFLSSFSSEYMSLNKALKDRPDLLDIVHSLRTRLVKDSYTENRIVETVFRHPVEIQKLYCHFSSRFNPTEKNVSCESDLTYNNIPHEIDRAVLEFFKLFNDVILKTNFYKHTKTSLVFRLDPTMFLDPLEYKEYPHGIFMLLGKEFRGFHIRFRDIARGGIRLVKSRDPESYDLNSDSIFDENYGLASTQQRKNKDIPEGGSKGTILLSLKYQDSGEIAFHKYVDGLFDVILPNEAVKDYLGKEEILFLGPDEGTADLMNWAMLRARTRGYKFWKAFSTGKALELGGIPHDLYGMTTNSVHEYVLGILDKLGIDEASITKVQTGGPDGDLGSNEILISKDKTTCIVDGSGVLYDPAGLDRAELTRLAVARVMVEKFDTKKLTADGFFVHVNDKDLTLPDGSVVENGFQFRNNFHLDARFSADLFVPCGGRPNSINIQNWKKLLDANGLPKFRFIVEGANLFLTQAARLALEEKGVIIFKDASANKGGVTSSSLEVFASLALSDTEYETNLTVKDDTVPEFRKQYVAQVLDLVRKNAQLEFEVLWQEHQRNRTPYAILTDVLSNKINAVNDAIHVSELVKNKDLMTHVVNAHCPSVLVEKLGIETILERVPQNYQQAILSAWIGSHFIYQYGLNTNEVQFHNFLQELM